MDSIRPVLSSIRRAAIASWISDPSGCWATQHSQVLDSLAKACGGLGTRVRIPLGPPPKSRVLTSSGFPSPPAGARVTPPEYRGRPVVASNNHATLARGWSVHAGRDGNSGTSPDAERNALGRRGGDTH